MATAIVIFVLLLFLSVPTGRVHAAEKIRISVSGSYSMTYLSAGLPNRKDFSKKKASTQRSLS